MTRTRYTSDPLKDMLVVEFEQVRADRPTFITAIRTHGEIEDEWTRLVLLFDLPSLRRRATVHRWRLLEPAFQPPEWAKVETYQWP